MTTTMSARATDPLTSHAAADGSTFRLRQADVLLGAFEKALGGRTAEEAAAATDLLSTGYWKRISDLLKAGYLQEDQFEATRVASTGRSQRVLHITAKGHRHLRNLRDAR